MKDGSDHEHSQQLAECPRTRLAQGALAAVDVCRCGMLQVHIGALTLRMAPCALNELLGTLGQAVAAQAAREFTEASTNSRLLGARERGEA